MFVVFSSVLEQMRHQNGESFDVGDVGSVDKFWVWDGLCLMKPKNGNTDQ